MRQPFLANSEFKPAVPCRYPLCTLGDLPLELVVATIGMAAPEVWQQSTCKHREGRLDLAPVRVPAPLTPSEQVRPLVGRKVMCQSCTRQCSAAGQYQDEGSALMPHLTGTAAQNEVP